MTSKINHWEVQISSLHEQTKQLKGLLDPQILVNAIIWAVTTGLKINFQLTSIGGAASNGTRFVSKQYLGKPIPSQVVPGADRSLNLDLECQYCKDTSHLKDNCIKLNHRLAMEQNKLGQNTAPNTHASKSNLAN